jgi:esterase/lipase superfamily enzyme
LKLITVNLVLLSVAALLVGCSGVAPLEIDLMPAPDVYDADGFNPLSDAAPITDLPFAGILYATDREPAGPGELERFYRNAVGKYLRLGAATIELGEEGMTWEEARRLSLLKNRTEKYPIKVTDVVEYGPLDLSAVPFVEPSALGEDPRQAARLFADSVNAKLAVSKQKHVFVYVHGYRVTFENPVLVATELWHYLGYDGVFIAYAWPSTPSRWAYLKDTETAAGYARNLRIFLDYLADETDAEQIHVLGYSAGTRLVARAFEQLALIHYDSTPDEIHAQQRIGNLIFVGSDMDRGIFGAYLADGLLEVPRHMSIYVSATDKALSFSQFLTRRERLGQMWQETPLHVSDLLNEHEAEFSLINVTGTAGSDQGNGHGYFRSSPWASSDILMTLMYGLGPSERGLVQEDESNVWTFPPDYIERLRESLAELNPSFQDTTE